MEKKSKNFLKNTNKSNHRFATTFVDGFADEKFSTIARKIQVPPRLDSLSKREFRLFDEITLFFRVLVAIYQERALLLFSSRGRLKPELTAIILSSIFPKKFKPKIVLYGEMFEPNHGIRHLIERAFMRLVDRNVDCYILFSSAEKQVFPATWGIDREKIRICHQFYDPPESKNLITKEETPGKHIFAGGNSFRDYDAFLEAACQLPDQKFEICTKKISPDQAFPPNVNISWPNLKRYLELIASAAVVVIPIQMGLKRTAGLLTCFESMWLQKTIIVPKALGLEDYVQDKVTGVIVEGTAESYIDAIHWVLDPKNEAVVKEIGLQARTTIENRFTLKRYIHCLSTIMEEAISM